MNRRGWLLFAAMGVIWGVPYLLIKVAIADLSPASLVLLRTVTGAVVLLPIVLARGAITPLRPHWRWILVYTGVEVAAPWMLLSDAERHISSSLAGLLIAGVPFVGALLALLTGGDDRLNGRRLAGLLVGLFGVATLVGFDLSGGNLGAVGEIAVVTVGYALGPMIIARRLRGVPAVGVVAASLVLTAIAYAPVGVLQLPHHAPSLQVILAVAGLGVVCTALAFLLFFALIAEVGPARATVITYVNPAVALLLGVAVLGERFTVATGVGFALILLGSYLATARATATSRRRRGRDAEMAPSTGVP
ncbi:MAG: EamA family transporter [Candidatus Dormibacteraeota bacterium]|uniref:EamA family transporter n=1 Tax=Candidatus Aeolococcus gillhamiae TaxID=3127015 RepID=A0A2W5YY53_9BACT|nr:EamA family transporter [Candidatus Dormibacteraeota bacterium]PZR77909.1 MAG: EamA family transporter [Candidatus Dormibacter sp. RRmetagenome_bin12]